MRRYNLILLMALMSCCAGCTRMAALSVVQAAPELELPAVRVLLGDEYDSVTVSSARTFRIDAIKAFDDTVTFYSISPMVIRRSMSGLMLIDRGWFILEMNVKSVRVSPQERGGYARVDGRPFRGELDIRSEGKTKLAVVNQLGMEPYLFGVVPREIGFSGPDMVQAIQAQAVAARTYAFSHLGQYREKDFDLYASVMDQVYDGVKAERPLVTAAVWATRGRVLKHDNEYVKAFYHSTCGGRTEAIEAVWGKDPQPYLVGTVDDEFCSWSSYWDWEEVITRRWLDSNVAAFVRKFDFGDPLTLGRLVRLEVSERRATGRVDELVITFENGVVKAGGDRSRWAFGRPSRNSGILPSASYSLKYDVEGADWTTITLRGHGYGHGIGMCQCGAIGRARAGQQYKDILLHYYSGATLDQGA
jgi:stage II sporulation protein D